MTDTSPTPADRPADQLRAAAELLREAAGHATPGPWRTHDTHLGGVGGHTATVLTDRPNLNDTELIAWLPTMSHEPWDEARNVWRNAGWMALVHPRVGLALADWLEREGLIWQAIDDASAAQEETGVKVTVGLSTHAEALAVARQLLGTTVDAGPGAEPSVDRRARYEEALWVHALKVAAAATAVMAVADAEQTELHAQIANLRTMYNVANDRTNDLIDERDKLLEAAAAPPAPADRAAVLTEAADFVRALLVSRPGVTTAGLEAELRTLAADAAAGVQPPTTCTCDFIDEPWIRMQHADDCPAAPAAPEEPTR
ncbi:hypothetical protein ACIQH7_05810 [Streptomyces anulatus]